MQAVKESARQVVEGLPEQCTWDDLLYALYVRQKIDQGLDDLECSGWTELLNYGASAF